jgi:hypothetical protein
MSKQTQAAAMEIEADLAEAVEAGDIEGTREISATELTAITEALIFVADEPLDSKTIAKVLHVEQSSVDDASRASRTGARVFEIKTECEAFTGFARDACRDRLQTTRDRARDFGNPWRAIALGDQDVAR